MAFRTMSSLLRTLPAVSTPVSLFSSQTATKILYRNLSIATNTIRRFPFSNLKDPVFTKQPRSEYHLLAKIQSSLLTSPQSIGLDALESKRTVIKFSMTKGRRKTVKAVICRFLRLDWGIWIHAKAGRNRHLWRKGTLQKKRSRQHVFCNAWHTKTLDRMTTKYWHKKKYWVNDPYEPYHTRPDFWITKNIKNIQHQLD